MVGAAGVAVGVGTVPPDDVGASEGEASTSDQAASSTEYAEPEPAGARRASAQAGSRSVSRSSIRPMLPTQQRATKAAMLPPNRQELTGAATETAEMEDPRDIAAAMLVDYGWSGSEFSCLDQLWVSESDWDASATNPSSGAYGIPQSLPADKMATAGSDWRTNPTTQIEWGLTYIRASYGTPCGAWSFKQSNNWH